MILDDNEPIQLPEIEATEQRPDPPPPPNPPAPIEVADPEVEAEIDVSFDDLPMDPATIPLPPTRPPVDPPQPPDEQEIFPLVEQQPELIGGLEGLQSRIRYPEMARRSEIEGTVILQFVVDEHGHVNDPVCLREPGGGTCEESLRAIREATFRPGRQRGQAVKVRFSLPVRFRLR